MRLIKKPPGRRHNVRKIPPEHSRPIYRSSPPPKKCLVRNHYFAAQVETYYLAHRDDYKVEDEVRLRMIVLTNSADVDAPLARKLAEEILSKLNEGAAFADLAEIYSQGSQRKEKGDWGWSSERFYARIG